MSAYVRGKYQIARWSEQSKATGHRLSEFEARDAYGADLLAEIDERAAALLLSSPDAIPFAIANRRSEVGVTTAALARYAGVPEPVVLKAESNPSEIPIQTLERLAFNLGLDERYIALERTAGADADLGVRLRRLTDRTQEHGLTVDTVLLLLEASSVIRVQSRLQRWFALGLAPHGLQPSPDFGDRERPAWRVGYELAETVRQTLGIGKSPIQSMRALVEGRFRIPVVQCDMHTSIAGATIESGADRGVVLNAQGQNQNVWVRRATLAHELCHLLFDPAPDLEKLRVDRYESADVNPETPGGIDYVEQRANAFAVALLAPPDEVRGMVPGPITISAVEEVMRHFGLGRVAARYHTWNASWRTYDPPDLNEIRAEPSAEQVAAEGLTLDYFQPAATPLQRRGLFAHLVGRAVEESKISDETGAQYLACSPDDLRKALPFLRELG